MSALVAPVEIAVTMPSGQVLLALAPAVLLLFGFLAYCLVDLARATSVRYLPKALWVVVILVVSPPFGAIAYLFVGRNRYEQAATPDPDAATRFDEHPAT